jgi:hypothetical protein
MTTESNETFIELQQDCPNFERFESGGFLVTEWDCGPQCIATFKQRINENGKLADNILYGGVLVQSEDFSRYLKQIACNPLPPDVFDMVRLISVRIDGARLMQKAT